ncbi:MAG TPA: bifunctional UDP-N-acetylglucosamine diphosphorylase/glucosamine-1-phosphate N-acetyltransferase GlmU [Mesotoga infera]|nr:bifunctional UDP-N-acetylglucosamine diphosphorylase/glucosamine-1-phosphate N-acetyltransferase GlmU [Mesotoga sp.]NLI05895.1 bifunctional UDP-N-acetylglucosamine diphosphorylase/glucosamine-1-phosphate N-acetyltransferase GlmU [Thermotogaceae bacterium]HNS66040.1 bifunctional UDP-N-acetylglucosamine diphosphorylase/glucosamine-1-phosphate N-acetyltransferase GlmU [Mesotoga infera]HOI33979.1 bifunctional UDP-N-acetylglucosamine diphosphorylase/glucosamine-1-phosphate N-acetyltransferase GlmU
MTGIVLAAGLGKRMRSNLPKAAHMIIDRPMVNWVISSLKEAGVDRVVVVTGYRAEIIESLLESDILTVRQNEQMGTGHAVMMAKDFLDDEDVVVVAGDEPLIKPSTLRDMVRRRREADLDVLFLTMFPPDPSGYGRVVKRDGKVEIVEERDASEEIRNIKEVNTGIYAFRGSFISDSIGSLRSNNEQGEYYLTDTVGMAARADTMIIADAEEVLGINNRAQLAQVARIARKRINNALMEAGVTIVDPETTYIGPNVKIGIDSVIEPMTFIYGQTTIGQNCLIGPMSRIQDSKIADNVEIVRSEVLEADVREGARVGPYSRLRPGAVIMEQAHVGNFVELKKSILGKRSKANHLTYLGDTTIGEDANIGAGTITCNYDGKNKFKTSIGDRAFIGSNSSLVAPVEIGEGSVTAAGSVITDDVPPYSLALGRARQINKEGKYKKNREEKD